MWGGVEVYYVDGRGIILCHSVLRCIMLYRTVWYDTVFYYVVLRYDVKTRWIVDE